MTSFIDSAAALPHTTETILNVLWDVYYRVLPTELKTFCALTAQITHRALTSMGLSAELVECQILYGYPKGNFAVGFTDKSQLGKWNGHVVCTCNGWLIDAATCHLQEAERTVPDMVIVRLLPAWSSVLAKKALDDMRSILWLRPPPGHWTPMPTEPEALVEKHGLALVDEIYRRL